jgi:hypothetical protein
MDLRFNGRVIRQDDNNGPGSCSRIDWPVEAGNYDLIVRGRNNIALKGGKIDFRVEKAGVVHAAVGRCSMDALKLRDNIVSLVQTLIRLKPATARGTYLRGAAISSTMGPGIRLDVNDLARLVEA